LARYLEFRQGLVAGGPDPARFHCGKILLQLSALILFILAHDSRAENESMTVSWGRFDIPPQHIIKGPAAGKGVGDFVINEISSRLTQFRYVDKPSNIPRLLFELRKSTTCAILFPSKARAAYMVFSDVVLTLPAFRIYTLINRAEALGYSEQKELSLRTLLDRGEVQIAASNHGYGQKIDEILANYPNLYGRRGTDTARRNVKMLMAGRIDGLIAHSENMMYMQDSLGKTAQLKSFSIREATTPGKLAVGCSKSNEGRLFVRHVNLIAEEINELSPIALTYWRQ